MLNNSQSGGFAREQCTLGTTLVLFEISYIFRCILMFHLDNFEAKNTFLFLFFSDFVYIVDMISLLAIMFFHRSNMSQARKQSMSPDLSEQRRKGSQEEAVAFLPRVDDTMVRTSSSLAFENMNDTSIQEEDDGDRLRFSSRISQGNRHLS